MSLIKSITQYLILLSFFLMAYTAPAQVFQAYIGTTEKHEIASDIKRLSNGNCIIVGYYFDSTVQNKNYFITLVSSTNTVLWAKGAEGHYKNQLTHVIEAQNGDFIAVGYSSENTPNGNQAPSLKRGLIVRYDQNGNLLWRKEYRLSATSAAGEQFTGVCEMPNGSIAITGTYDERGGFSEGLIGFLNSNGTPNATGFVRFDQCSASDGFSRIKALGNDIIVSGVRTFNSQYDGTVVKIDSNGKVIFSKQYGYSSPIVSGNHYNWFSDIHIKDNKIIVNTANIPNWTNVTSDIHGVIIMDLDGTNARSTEFSNPNSLQHKLAGNIYPLTKENIIVVNNPSNTPHIPYAGVTVSDGIISRINPATPSVLYTKSFLRSGHQSLNQLDYRDSIVSMAGAGIQDPENFNQQKYDIFLLHTDINVSDGHTGENNPCGITSQSISAANTNVADQTFLLTGQYETGIHANTMTKDVDLSFTMRYLCGKIPTSAKFHGQSTDYYLSNYPNPFSSNTTIQYQIPGNYKNAEIKIISGSGVIVRNIPLDAINNGEINFSAEELSSGVYFLTLVIDGQKALTQKMFITE